MLSLSPLEALVRLTVALVLGALVGFERERGERSAGLRTLALVALGSALIMIVSAYGFAGFKDINNVRIEPSQIAAQVVTGIGFLGAGAIFMRKEVIKGLTTAAATWLVAGIGLACGIGLIWEALSATVLGLVVLAVLRPFERKLFPLHSAHLVRVRLQPGVNAAEVIGDLERISASAGVLLDGLELRPGRRGELVVLRCRAHDRSELVRMVGLIQALPLVRLSRADLYGVRVTSTPSSADAPKRRSNAKRDVQRDE